MAKIKQKDNSFIGIVNVLGTNYTIERRNKKEDSELAYCDGYCDTSIKLIVIIDVNSLKKEGSVKDLYFYEQKVLRHELVHAFLFESGLAHNSSWATNEELVDWIALQFNKLQEVFNQIRG